MRLRRRIDSTRRDLYARVLEMVSAPWVRLKLRRDRSARMLAIRTCAAVAPELGLPRAVTHTLYALLRSTERFWMDDPALRSSAAGVRFWHSFWILLAGRRPELFPIPVTDDSPTGGCRAARDQPDDPLQYEGYHRQSLALAYAYGLACSSGSSDVLYTQDEESELDGLLHTLGRLLDQPVPRPMLQDYGHPVFKAYMDYRNWAGLAFTGWSALGRPIGLSTSYLKQMRSYGYAGAYHIASVALHEGLHQWMANLSGFEVAEGPAHASLKASVEEGCVSYLTLAADLAVFPGEADYEAAAGAQRTYMAAKGSRSLSGASGRANAGGGAGEAPAGPEALPARVSPGFWAMEMERDCYRRQMQAIVDLVGLPTEATCRLVFALGVRNSACTGDAESTAVLDEVFGTRGAVDLDTAAWQELFGSVGAVW